MTLTEEQVRQVFAEFPHLDTGYARQFVKEYNENPAMLVIYLASIRGTISNIYDHLGSRP